MEDSGVLPETLGRLYGAIPETDAESTWLDMLRDRIGAEHAILAHRIDGQVSVHTSRLDEWMYPLARRLAAATIFDASLERLPPLSAHRFSDHFPVAELKKTDVYHELVRPLEGGHALAFAWPRQSGLSAVAICRDCERRHDFSGDDIAAIQPLLMHVHNAMHIRARLALAEDVARASQAALDAIEDGVILLDSTGGVSFANRVARSMLLRADALLLDRNGLRACRIHDDGRLRRLVRQASRVARMGDDGPARAWQVAACMAIDRRHVGARPLQVSVVPASTFSGSGFVCPQDAVVAILLTDPERVAFSKTRAAANAFGLTPREAELALALVNGLSLVHAAARIGITPGTARQYLKSIFAKTGVHRQAELVRLLLSRTSLEGG